MKTGVVALQGGVAEHVSMLRRIGAETVEVRLPEDLEGLDALIIPGGESTTLIRLMERWALADPIGNLVRRGLPVWGTCAGAILLCSEISESEHEISQRSLGLARVKAVRNAFGRQVHSFVQDLQVEGIAAPYPGVFIRAPLLEPLDPCVQVLARIGEGAVFLREDRMWLSSFHPELTDDPRVHELFLGFARES
ncbi:pyridoxal 5'-phosphate synthase glutaminase subunit PdxT [Candidatus Fermentibacteria bacterium]|nr:pyridoxal 5'-phosphate synthase glutaminase subunit PdxT [Candidatus Fermentibacteria bacterium]